jgi:hypothetical protein
MAPFRNPDGHIYLGKKTTSYVLVNPRTGEILDRQHMDDHLELAEEKNEDQDVEALQVVRTGNEERAF